MNDTTLNMLIYKPAIVHAKLQLQNSYDIAFYPCVQKYDVAAQFNVRVETAAISR